MADMRPPDEKYFAILFYGVICPNDREVNFYGYLTVEMYTIIRGVSPKLDLIFPYLRVQLPCEGYQFTADKF